MIDLKMPEDTIGNISDGEIARGPFVAVHNGTNTLGGFMGYSGDGGSATFYSDARSHTVDDENYVITNSEFGVAAISIEWQSTWIFRSLTEDDIEWMVPADELDDIQTLEQLVEWAKDQLSGVSGA